MNAVIDEDLPRSFATVLQTLGFTVFDVRDHGLRGEPDEKVYLFAQEKKAVLFSGDLGFSNILHFPLGIHFGICILRYANEISVSEINKMSKELLLKVDPQDYRGNLIILSPGKLRLRRYKQAN